MFVVPELPYDYSSLEPFIDEETMRIHHDKHHLAYVKNTNDALAETPQLLEMNPIELYLNLDKVPESVRVKVKNNLGGHINHSMFWEILASDSTKIPSGKILESINLTFGDFETFKAKFNEAGLGRFGSGWVWLVVNRNEENSEKSKLEIVSTANQDNPIIEGKTPILGLDLWEHAYYLKYKNMRADYIDAFWNIVNWKQVAENYTKEGETK